MFPGQVQARVFHVRQNSKRWETCKKKGYASMCGVCWPVQVASCASSEQNEVKTDMS